MYTYVTDSRKHKTWSSGCIFLFRLGEACSHLAALLSCLVTAVESRERAGTDSITSLSCKWLPPTKNVCILSFSVLLMESCIT